MAREVATTKVEPSFLVKYQERDQSTESLREYRVLSRARVGQGLTDKSLLEIIGLGGVALVPGNQPVIRLGEAFEFVPLYQYTEFIQWRDRRDKNADGPIVDKTLNRESELARKSRDEDERWEEYEGGPKSKPYMYRYVEHICFIGVIYGDHELAGTPIGISFERGEIYNGKSYCSAIMMRKVGGVQAPLWSTVWRLTTSERTRDDNSWYGFDFSNAENPYIQEGEADEYEQLHLQMKKLIETNSGGISREEVETVEDEM